MVTRVTCCKMKQFLTGSWNFAWLLVAYSLVTFMLSCSWSMQLFMRYSIKEDTYLEKNACVFFKGAISCCIWEVYAKCS